MRFNIHFLTLPLLLSLTVFCGESRPALKISGSDSMLQLSQHLARGYMSREKSGPVAVLGGGSSTGIAQLNNHATDIAAVSREITAEERIRLQKSGEIYSRRIALDSILIIVNPAHKSDSISLETLRRIYTGELKKWPESALPVTALARDTASGTFAVFNRLLFPYSRDNIGGDVLRLVSNRALVQQVAANPGAIAFISSNWKNNRVKALSITDENGRERHPADKDYPFRRPLYFYAVEHDHERSVVIKKFFAFLNSAQSREIISSLGYRPVGQK